MTEQELKDAITSACEADYKHAMACLLYTSDAADD